MRKLERTIKAVLEKYTHCRNVHSSSDSLETMQQCQIVLKLDWTVLQFTLHYNPAQVNSPWPTHHG